MTEISTKDKVRLLISDVGGADGESFLYTDEEILAFLELATESNVFEAAAIALRSMAANEAMVLKRITFLDLSTDGPATAKALRESATDYDEKADEDVGDFDIADINTGGFADRKLLEQYLAT